MQGHLYVETHGCMHRAWSFPSEDTRCAAALGQIPQFVTFTWLQTMEVKINVLMVSVYLLNPACSPTPVGSALICWLSCSYSSAQRKVWSLTTASIRSGFLHRYISQHTASGPFYCRQINACVLYINKYWCMNHSKGYFVLVILFVNQQLSTDIKSP